MQTSRRTYTTTVTVSRLVYLLTSFVRVGVLRLGVFHRDEAGHSDGVQGVAIPPCDQGLHAPGGRLREGRRHGQDEYLRGEIRGRELRPPSHR